MTDELIGKKIGGYEILDRIGQGGMATVYRARQTSMNRIVALKVLPRHFVRDDTYLQRFEREVKIIAQLEHRNIVPVHDYGEYDGMPYIAMRYLPGGSVDDLVKAGPLDLDRILDIVEQIAPALDYAHSKDVLHRDLKPSNILLDDGGGAYITDFGIARILGTEGQGTTITTQGVVGTPSYMSPEQAQGHSLDGRSDVYSLGIMLFEMLTGRRPFQNETPYGIAVMQVTKPPPSPRSINPEITLAIEQVILKTLKKIPENRYQTATQMAEALRLAVERPDSIHDTQPRGIQVKEKLQQATQPSSAQGQHTVPSSVAGQPVSPLPVPPPAYTPAPQSQVRQSSSLSARVRQRKKSGNFWISVIIGSVIGCALLTAVVVIAMVAVSNFLEESPPPATSPVPTLDPTSEAAREELLSAGIPGSNPEGTPVYTGATAIPTRTSSAGATAGTQVALQPTPTFDPAFDTESSVIVYFGGEDNHYDIFTFDLRTGERTRLTNDSTANSYPLASPDGTQIAFQSNRDGDFDIYVMNVNGGRARQLTNNDVIDRLPAWSPDGEWIIYSSDTRGDGNYDLYRARASGGEPELIYSDGKRNSHARYSHDGRYLVFTSGESWNAATWEIVKLDLSTGEVDVLTNNGARDSSPSFSPDDETILYATDGEGGAAIATLSADGRGMPTILYDSDGFEWGMNYSPDGAFIVFNVDEGSESTLYMMRADGSRVREIGSDGGFYPSWVH